MEECLPPLAPGNSFLRDYTNYARQITDAPDAYHLAVALSIFSTAVCDRTLIPRGPTGIPPTLWMILVGRSRHDRKTTSIRIGTALAKATAMGNRLIEGTSSAEGLQRLLSEYPARTMLYPEFGRYLEAAGSGYEAKQRRLMMELFDPSDGEFKHDLGKGTKNRILNHRLGMLAACATTFILHKTKREDWEGGFFGRSIIVFGNRGDRNQPQGSPDPIASADLRRRIEAMTTTPIPVCGGLTKKADEIFHSWDILNDQRSVKANDLVQTFYGGMCTTAWKIAMLYALDTGTARDDGWLINEQSAYYAIKFCESIWRPSFEALAGKIVLDADTAVLYRVENAIEQAGTTGIKRSELARATRLTTRKMN